MNHYYPTKVFLSRWKPNSINILQIGCRPDALAPLCADICLIGGRSAPPIIIGSVEHREGDVASFLISIEVPKSFREDLLALIDSYTRKT